MVKEFEYEGVKYVPLNFANQYTFEQADLIEPILKKVTEVAIVLQNYANQKKKPSELEISLKIKEAYQSSKVMPELLAHTWINENDRVFNQDTYGKRVVMFKTMPMGLIQEKGLEEAIAPFLAYVLKSSMGGITSLIAPTTN